MALIVISVQDDPSSGVDVSVQCEPALEVDEPSPAQTVALAIFALLRRGGAQIQNAQYFEEE